MMMMMSFEEILKMVEKATINTKRMYWQDEILNAATKIYMKQMELSNKEIEKEIMRNDKLLEQEPCEDAISRKALIERINKAEDDFKADNMEIIASGGDSFVDGVLSGVFNVRKMVIQAQSICKAESEEK